MNLETFPFICLCIAVLALAFDLGNPRGRTIAAVFGLLALVLFVWVSVRH